MKTITFQYKGLLMIAKKSLPILIGMILLCGCQPAATTEGLAQLPETMAGVSDQVGVQTWIEFPPEGETLPLEPLTIIAYAADTAGIAGIEVSVNGQALPAGTVKSESSDGSSQLVRLDQPWQPSKPGTFIIEARSRGASGSAGGSAMVTICILYCEGETPTPTAGETDTPTPAMNLTGSPAPDITITASLTPTGTRTSIAPPAVTINFSASPPYINGGQCTTLSWSVTGAQSVYLDNAPVNNSGSIKVCPCETTYYTITAVKADTNFEDAQVRVDVYGSCQAPPLPTTAVPPPQDTSGPTISISNVQWSNCQLTVDASISDVSSVPWSTLYYNINGQGWNSTSMSLLGGGIWRGQVTVPVGMETPIGSIQYYITASDGIGNQSEGGNGTYDYMGCGG